MFGQSWFLYEKMKHVWLVRNLGYLNRNASIQDGDDGDVTVTKNDKCLYLNVEVLMARGDDGDDC